MCLACSSCMCHRADLSICFLPMGDFCLRECHFAGYLGLLLAELAPFILGEFVF